MKKYGSLDNLIWAHDVFVAEHLSSPDTKREDSHMTRGLWHGRQQWQLFGEKPVREEEDITRPGLVNVREKLLAT